jgi:hypothetical protein
MLGVKTSGDKILFRGSSCYPLSPADEEEEGGDAGANAGNVKQIDSNDQLLKILAVLGNQTKLDKKFFERKEMYEFYN